MQSIWNDIIQSFEKHPRDVATVPMRNSACKWFYVSVKDGNVLIESGKEHNNSSKIKNTRKLNPSEFENMVNLYYRRKDGENVSQEAASISMNQVYWYGIFHDMGL